VPPSFRPVDLAAEAAELSGFLCAHEWPYHGRSRLRPEDIAAMELGEPDAATFWIDDGGEHVGVVRLFDLADLDDGSPMFDLRLAPAHRGRGLGTASVRWLTGHLFTTYPTVHRIEATTRIDNAAMRAVFERCGYQLEGRLRETWPDATGARHDTMVYGILRREWAEETA
jgi:RimJ/RimL family protein N-acetyltransferase